MTEELDGRCKWVMADAYAGKTVSLWSMSQFFSDAFDPVQAKRESVITPRPGVDAEYDQAKQDIAELTAQLDSYLKEQRKRLGCDISYWGSGKDR